MLYRHCFSNFASEYTIRRVQVKQDGLKLNGTYHLLVYADDNVFCGSVHTVENKDALGRAYTHRQNRCRYRCCHQYNPGLVYTHTDKMAIGACKAVNFVSDADQSTWLTCGIGFICCVCFIS